MSQASIIYLSRTGLLEPLGQSQVFAYLRGLSKNYSITLITYEKFDDWSDTARMTEMQEQCARLGIDWIPKSFQSYSSIGPSAADLLRMFWLTFQEVKRRDAKLIHARSYVPAIVGLAVHRLTGVPFLFDMRALWPEELIASGRLKRHSIVHQIVVWLERACLREASGVVSLTHSAAAHLRREHSSELSGKTVVVIPTCTDLDRFRPAFKDQSAPKVHGCIGTILSGWFRIDWLAAWLACVAQEDSAAQFEIVTRDDPVGLRAALDPLDLLHDRIQIVSRTSKEMPEAIQGHDLTVMFYDDGLASLGRAPTRMAEALACGLPVVVNAGVGDVTDIVLKNRVGVLISSPDSVEMRSALEELRELMRDPELKSRCRSTAESVFSLASGTDAYGALYAAIIDSHQI